MNLGSANRTRRTIFSGPAQIGDDADRQRHPPATRSSVTAEVVLPHTAVPPTSSICRDIQRAAEVSHLSSERSCSSPSGG